MELNITRESAQQRTCTQVVTGNTQTSQAANVYHKKSAMFQAGVTSLDRWLVKKIVTFSSAKDGGEQGICLQAGRSSVTVFSND